MMKRKISLFRTGSIFLFLVLAGIISLNIYRFVFAVTPDPGHPWSGVGDGTFVVTGPTASRTYTFPDANATVLTSNAAVTVAQGGTGQTTANAAFNALAPSQTGNDTKFLRSNGTDTSWVSPTTTYVIFSTTSASLTADTNCNPSGGTCANNAIGYTRIPTAMRIDNLYVRMTTAPASSNSCGFTVQVANDPCTSFSNTALGCTVTGNGSLTTCTDTNSPAAITAGQCIRIFFDETGTCTGADNWTFYGYY